MNNRFVLVIFSLIMLSACRKDTEVVLDDPDARLTEALSSFQETLVSAPHGWKGTLYPSLRGAYSFYLQFGPDNTVTMVGDVNATAGKTVRQSTYRLKALQQPTLIFDTYNYLHLLDDPNPDVMGGTRNAGLGSDIEFAFVSSGDTLKVQGIGNKTPFTLVKATEAEAAQYKAGRLEAMIKANDDFVKANPNAYLEFAAGQKVQFKMSGKALTINYADGDNLVSRTAYYSHTLGGFYLKTPLTVGDISFREVFYDEAQKKYYVLVNNARYEVQNAATPVLLPLHFQFGKNKDFSLLTVNPTTTTGQSADFLTVFNAAKANLIAVGAGRVMESFSINFSDVETMILRVNYKNTAGSSFVAAFTYKIVYSPNTLGPVKFVYVTRDANATIVAPGIVALTDYLEKNEFRMEWQDNPGSATLLGKFYKVADPASFFIGVVSK